MDVSICSAVKAIRITLTTSSPDHDYYNPITDTWHRLEPMPIAVHGVTGLAFINGYIHLPGGGTAQGGSSGSTIHQVYQPRTTCN